VGTSRLSLGRDVEIPLPWIVHDRRLAVERSRMWIERELSIIMETAQAFALLSGCCSLANVWTQKSAYRQE
jgi:hypothetical protein